MINLQYNEAVKLLKDNNCPVFSGEMNPTLFGIRESQTYTNGFSDTLGVLWTEKGQNKIITISGSTKPGLYGDGAILNPKVIHGIKGTAVMIPGHYKGLWKMMNFHLFDLGKGTPPKGSKSYNPWAYPYLHQVGKCKLYRDGNMDLVITRDIVTDSVGDGINCHYMSDDTTPDIIIDDNLNNWSLGCQGSPPPQLSKIFNVLHRCSGVSGLFISYSLLDV